MEVKRLNPYPSARSKLWEAIDPVVKSTLNTEPGLLPAWVFIFYFVLNNFMELFNSAMLNYDMDNLT